MPVATMPQPSSIFNNTVCLSLTLGCFGTSRMVPTGAIDTGDTDKRMLRIHKDILKSPELEAVRRIDREIRGYVTSRALPNPILRSGVYPLPVALAEEVDTQLNAYVPKRVELVVAFLGAYRTREQEARELLGHLHSAADYEPLSVVQSEFNFDWQMFTLESSTQLLNGVSRDFFEKQRAKLEAACKDAADTIPKALTATMAELVNDLHGRLQRNPDGTWKTIRPSKLLERFTDFLSHVDIRNITDDQQLKALTDKAKALLAGVDTDSLCNEDTVKGKLADGLSVIKAELDAAITSGGRLVMVA